MNAICQGKKYILVAFAWLLPLISAASDLDVGPINENPPKGAVLGSVLVGDASWGDVVVSYPSGNTANAIEIDPDSGEVKVNNPAVFDREQRSMLEISYKATDGVRTEAGLISIYLNDINEHPTSIPAKRFRVVETSGNGTVVGRLDVVDLDVTKPGFNWEITGGNTGGLYGWFRRRVPFAINSQTGEITVRDNGDFGRILYQNYELNIRASGQQTINTIAYIDIVGENEYGPDLAPATFNISENLPSGAFIGDLSAPDPDGDQVTFTLLDDSSGGGISLNSTNGRLTVQNSSKLDREAFREIYLTVRADDGEKSDTETITITLSDVNEYGPTLNPSTFNIDENPAPGELVGLLQFNDQDAEPGHVFSITAGNKATPSGPDLFQIDSLGQLKIASPDDFDFERYRQLTIEVLIEDGAYTDSALVTINILDVNETPPTGNPLNLTIDENLPNGTLIGRADARDDDSEQVIVYSIDAGNTANAFTIDTATGDIFVAKSDEIDREKRARFDLLIGAYDGFTLSQYGAVISLNDEDEHDIIAVNQAAEIFETASNGTVVIDIAATDADATDTPNFEIVGGNDPAAFSIDPQSGVIKVSDESTLDADAKGLYTLQILITSGDKTKAVTAEILVRRVNLHSPDVSDVTFSIPENSPSGHFIGALEATDKDGDPISYQIMHSSEPGMFELDPVTGQIHVLDSSGLDRELIPYATLICQVSDGYKSSTAKVTINVEDENEHPIVLGDAVFSINENPAKGEVVGIVTGSDQDAESSLRYSIISGNEGSSKAPAPGNYTLFAIDPSSGIISIDDAKDFDHETNQSFTITVQANDQKSGDAVTSKVEVSILDVNEYAPSILDQTLTLPENTPDNTLVTVVTAEDMDRSPEHSFEIAAGNLDGIFRIDPSTGEIFVARSFFLDAERHSSLTLLVGVADGDNYATANIRIDISDVNEFPPNATNTEVTIDENPTAGQVLGQIVATDQDRDATLTTSFVFDSSSGGLAVSPDGEVTVADPLLFDREAIETIVGEFEVSDGENTVTSSFTVILNDINEHEPLFVDQSASIREDARVKQKVHKLAASDQDATAQLTFSIIDGNQLGLFSIAPDSGWIVVEKELDAETLQQVDIDVSVSDGQNTTSALVTIYIEDVNEFPPVLTPPAATSIPENTPPGTYLGTYLATDKDVTSALTYSISGGDPAGLFSLDAVTGDLLVASGAQLDAETTEQFNLSIRVSDGKFTDTVTHQINLTDENEFTPVFEDDLTKNLDENSDVGEIFGSVSALDHDVTGDVSYSITGGDGAGLFSLSPISGELSVLDNSGLDREVVEFFTLEVEASDGERSSSAVYKIYLNDINEFPPTGAAFDAHVLENEPSGTPIGYVIGQDGDATAKLTYRLVDEGANNGVFNLDLESGLLSVGDSKKLDAETYESLSLVVIVSDGKDEVQDVINIVIDDVNEYAPIFEKNEVELLENADVGTLVTGIHAVDNDREGQVTYSISGGEAAENFSINEETGALTLLDNSNIDAETNPVLNLVVIAGDGERQTKQSIKINVIDVNESTLSVQDAEINVEERAVSGSSLHILEITDEDHNPRYEFVITHGNEEGLFEIGQRGDIRLTEGRRLDYEANRVHELTIDILDGEEVATATVLINVTDTIEWSRVAIRASADSPRRAWQGLSEHTITLEEVGASKCILTQDLQLALTDSDMYCHLDFVNIPDGLINDGGLSVSGVFNTLGPNKLEWRVGRATPYNEISYQRSSTYTVDVLPEEGPEIEIQSVRFSDDGRYVASPDGRFGNLRNYSRAPLVVTLKDENGVELVSGARVSSSGTLYLSLGAGEFWEEKVYTLTAGFEEEPGLTTTLSLPTILVSDVEIAAGLDIARTVYDDTDMPVKLLVGDENRGDFTFSPSLHGSWLAHLAYVYRGAYIPITDPVAVDDSLLEVSVPKDKLEEIADKNLVAIIDFVSPVEGYAKRVVSRYKRPRILRGGPVLLDIEGVRTEGAAPMQIDLRLTGSRYHRASMGEIIWEKSANGGSNWSVVEGQVRTRLAEKVVDAGEFLYRARVLNKYTGAVHVTDPVRVFTYDRLSLEVEGPTYLLTGSESKLTARAYIGETLVDSSELEFIWSIFDRYGNSTEYPGQEFTYSETENPHNLRAELKVRYRDTNTSARNVWEHKRFTLSVVKPRKVMASLSGPTSLEVGKTYKFTPRITPQWSTRSSTAKVVSQWTLPDGTIIEGNGDALEWGPDQQLLDEIGFGSYTKLYLSSWVEGYRADTETTVARSIKIWKYEWPEFLITARPRYQEAPTDITLEVRPEDHNWFRRIYGEEITYNWTLPPGMVELSRNKNRLYARVFEGGDYEVNIDVSDTRGNAASAAAFIEVGDTPSHQPTMTLRSTNRYNRIPFKILPSLSIRGGHRENPVTNIIYTINGEIVKETLSRYPRFDITEAGDYTVEAMIETELGINSNVSSSFSASPNKAPVCTLTERLYSTNLTVEAVCKDEDGYIIDYSWILDGVPLSLSSRRVGISTNNIKPGGSSISVEISDDSGAKVQLSTTIFP